MASLNSGRSWIITRLEVAGFGKRFGTTPFGQRASAYHLGSTTYASSSPASANSGYTQAPSAV